VAPVLPMLVPEPVGVGTGGDKARGDTASILLAFAIPLHHHNLVVSNFRQSGIKAGFVIRSRVRVWTY
jgi:hypothetical protein